MLGSVGDLLEDVVVHVHEDVNVASDTNATVVRRRGGSAANVIAAACRAGGTARFIGQVGDDAIGRALVDELTRDGAEVEVRRAGRTGTIIVMLDEHGERTMITDRAACIELADPQQQWLDGLDTLHVPYYSLPVEPLGATTRTLAGWAVDRGIRVSVDTSSVSVLERVGPEIALEQMRALRPSVVLANEMEAALFGPRLHPDHLRGALVIIKQGADPAIVLQSGMPPQEVPAEVLTGVRDTTGAGDAFAAGLLLGLAAGEDPVTATRRGHAVAAAAVRRVSGHTG